MNLASHLRHGARHRARALQLRRARGRTLVLAVGPVAMLRGGPYGSRDLDMGDALRVMGVPRRGAYIEQRQDHARCRQVITLKMKEAVPLRIDRGFFEVLEDSAPWADTLGRA